jgi:hypothetical protein
MPPKAKVKVEPFFYTPLLAAYPADNNVKK